MSSAVSQEHISEKAAVTEAPSTELPVEAPTDDSSAVSAADTPKENDGQPNYPKGVKLAAQIAALCLTVFCVALDNTIIATAIPKITDQFHSLQDVGWYGSAYLLTTCAFQLFFGKLYSMFNVKWVFYIALFIFELGSLICGVAPNSLALIWGRAIAGLGSAGLFSGALIIIAYSAPVHKRPVFLSLLGGMYGIASVVGPLLGGAFTDNVTWRWCFYINLPIGGVAAAVLIPTLKLPPKKIDHSKTFRQILWSLDPLGTIFFVASIVCLLTALQFGGTTWAWNDGRTITFFVVFGVLLIAFVVVQIWLGEGATVPPRIVSQRTVASVSLFALCLGGAFFVLVYFVPLWFQAIKGVSALQSGIDNIALILANVIGIIIAGGMTTKFGYYMPFIFLSVILSSIGTGLITTFQPNTSTGHWIGYQIIYGFGAGFAFQLPPVAAQTVLKLEDVAIGTAFTLFMQLFGGALFVSVGNNVLSNNLVKYIGALNLPDVDPLVVVSLGATQLRGYVKPQYVDQVVGAYNTAIVKVFQVALILCCLTALGAAGMEWRSVKAATAGQGDAEKARESEA